MKSSPAYPIPIPERLPVKIVPCPIVEAIFELRFTTDEPWATMPGLLYTHIREKYPKQQSLPLSRIPEEIRRQESSLLHKPLLQFLGTDFLIQLGPRVASLVTQPREYPGWQRIQQELSWLFEKLQSAGFVREGERLGVRYIDFFQGNIIPQLNLGVHVDEVSLDRHECQITTVFQRETLSLRLAITNSAIVGGKTAPEKGSVLDVDAWYGALDFDLFQDGLERFNQAHQCIKELFFGLLKPSFLTTLSPVYS